MAKTVWEYKKGIVLLCTLLHVKNYPIVFDKGTMQRSEMHWFIGENSKILCCENIRAKYFENIQSTKQSTSVNSFEWNVPRVKWIRDLRQWMPLRLSDFLEFRAFFCNFIFHFLCLSPAHSILLLFIHLCYYAVFSCTFICVFLLFFHFFPISKVHSVRWFVYFFFWLFAWFVCVVVCPMRF